MEASAEGEASAPPPRASSPTMSGFVAAGIVGGLIALVGAGALQYAGVIPSTGSAKDDSAVSKQVATLAAEVESLKAGSANGAVPADLSGLENRLSQLEAGQQQTAVDPAAVSDLQAKLASANQAIDQLKSDLAGRVEKLTENQTEVSDKVSAIETKINKPRDDIEVARAIAASALKTAADRGGPFLAELRTLGSIAPEDTAIAALEPYATTGVTSRIELQRQFGPVADKILSTINAPAESANIGERLWASAMSVVKVRPVGNVEGDSASAIVARIEDKIRNGDLKVRQPNGTACLRPGATSLPSSRRRSTPVLPLKTRFPTRWPVPSPDGKDKHHDPYHRLYPDRPGAWLRFFLACRSSG